MNVLRKIMASRKFKFAALATILLCLFATALLPSLLSKNQAHAAEAPILISEVVSSNSHSLTDPVLGSPDWVELYNPNGQSVDLAGYRLADKTNSNKGVLPDVTIPAGGYLIIYADKIGTQSSSGKCCVDFSLSKSGVKLYLFNTENIVSSQLNVPALPTDISYARRDDGTYGYCANPTPGAKNDSTRILDSTALKDVLQAGSLRINEVLPKVSGGYAWAELYNAGQTDVNLGDYCLTDLQNKPDKWHLPQSVLAAGQYAVVYLSGLDKASPEMHTSFKLGSQDTALYLFDIMGNLASDMTWYQEIPQGVSIIAGNQYTASPTKGAENSKETFPSVTPTAMDSSDPVRLNEVLPKNKYSVTDSDGDREEWVELYNGSDQDIPLKNYFLTDNKNDLFKWQFPDVKISAKSYTIVFLSGKQSKTGELHASFRLSSGEGGVWFTSLGLAGIRDDTIALPATIGENISVGRDEKGTLQYYAQPTPGSHNAEGFADPALMGNFDKDGVFISEVSAASKVKSGANDWVELHNGSSVAVDLSGCYLSNDVNTPTLWKMPSLKIGAGGYAVVEASSNPTNTKTADFSISPAGETLLLSNAQGKVLDKFDTGVLSPGITSGRIEGNDAVARVFFNKPTRGKPNTAKTLSGYTAAPLLSETALYHTKAFQLSIACATPNAKVFYTTDGSMPTKASKAYTGPISIGKNTAVRAVAYADGCMPSEPATGTYLFDKPHTVPVVCLTGKPSEMGILIKWQKETGKPEYPTNVEYYGQDGTLGVEFPSGLRPKGRASLRLPQNSYTMVLRSDYGQKNVTYPFFAGSDIKTYTELTLRVSGQDTPAARMRDTLFQRIEKGMDVTSIATKSVVVYINGQYEGLYDLEEEENSDYLASHYGVDPKKIDMINRNGIVMHGSDKEYDRIVKMAKTWNMADNKVFAEFSKYVDVDACTDYLVAQTYFGSGDVVNTRFWRAQDYSEKWQPFLFDLDYNLRFNDLNRNQFDRYFIPTPHLSGTAISVNMYIYCALRKNAAWRDKFVQRYIQLAETQFSTDRVLKIFDGLKAEMKPEMAQDIARWHMPGSMQSWEKQTGALRNVLTKRQSVALKQLQQYFHVPSATMQKYIKKYSVNS